MMSSPSRRRRDPARPRPPLPRLLRPRIRRSLRLRLHLIRTAGMKTDGVRNERWLPLIPPTPRNIGPRAQDHPTIPSTRTGLTMHPVQKRKNHHQGLDDLAPWTVITREITGPPTETGIATPNDTSRVASLPSWGGISVVTWRQETSCEKRHKNGRANIM